MAQERQGNDKLDRYERLMSPLCLDRWEVIGKIYENKDLCKTSTDKGGE